MQPGHCRYHVTLPDGREVTIRPIVEADAPRIEQAFDRLSAISRYLRFMQSKPKIDRATLERGVHPRPGRDFVLVATIPAAAGIDIVGAAQYVGGNEPNEKSCEFAITVAEDWRGSGLAVVLLSTLLHLAGQDGYHTMEGWVSASNAPMLGLAHKLDFDIERTRDDATVLRVWRAPAPCSGWCHACSEHASQVEAASDV